MQSSHQAFNLHKSNQTTRHRTTYVVLVTAPSTCDAAETPGKKSFGYVVTGVWNEMAGTEGAGRTVVPTEGATEPGRGPAKENIFVVFVGWVGG